MTDAPKSRWFGLSLRTVLVPIAVSLLIACIGLFIWIVELRRESLLREEKPTLNYVAVEWVAELVCEHMRTHHGAWPKSWEDLRLSYGRLGNPPQGEVISFDELHSRVDVDFDVDPRQMHQTMGKDWPLFKPVRPNDGSNIERQGIDPNRWILTFIATRWDLYN